MFVTGTAIRGWARCSVAASAATILALACLYSVHGARAQLAYFRVEYGQKASLPETLACCGKCLRLCPSHYRVCRTASGKALEGWEKSGRKDEDLYRQAGEWCDRGLRLNPFDMELQLARVLFLAGKPGTRGEALRTWETYTERHYWNPKNLRLLAQMYALSGILDKAESLAGLLRNGGFHGDYRLVMRAIAESRGEHNREREAKGVVGGR